MSSTKFKRFRLVAVAAATALATGHAVLAQSVPATSAETNVLWFVELTGKTVADGASLAAVQSEQTQFRAAALNAGTRFRERRSFNTLFNGFSAQLSPAQRATIAKLPGVRALYPVETIQAPSPEVSDATPDMVAALSLTRANIAQNSLGLSGLGVKVAIIDTGIDYDHLAFGGDGVARANSPQFPNARVTHGYDFVGDAFTGGNIPMPGITPPDDCAEAGHGTHVAGIVAANGGGVLGVAPKATLGAYRVFGCTGSTTADIMLAAMEMALADGMHVINMSIGSRAQWPQYPTGQAASRLAKKGVVVVTSIGNNGPGGSAPDALFAAGAPGVGENVIGVASFDNAQRSFLVAGVPYGFNSATASPLAPSSGSMPLARTPSISLPPSPQTSPATPGGIEGCPALADYPTATWQGGTTLAAGSLAGQVLLVRRGTCGFHAKAWNAQQAGAIGVIIYNNAAGAIAPTVAGNPAITVPVVAITQAQGNTLSALIGAGPTQLTWTGDYVGHPFGTGGLISGFSSFGMAADLSLKPDIGAPGGGILSTYPLESGGSATLSGTSMSSPHVAGAAALILEAIPTAALGVTGPIISRNAPPAINMATRMMNTAVRKNWSGSPDLGLLEYSFRQGAGMIDIVAAVQTQQFVTPGKFSTGESETGAKVQRLTIRNDSTSPVTYTMGHVAGVAAGPNTRGTGAAWTLGGTFDAPAGVAFSSANVVVPAKGMATVDVTVTTNGGLADRSLQGGYITLTPQGPGTPLHVPYAGIKGDYQSIAHLGIGPQTAAPMPWLATTTNGTSFSRCATPCPSYSMVGFAKPYLTVSLAHHVRTLKLEAFDQATGQARGSISLDEYVGRNTTPGGFFSMLWDGTTSMGLQINGTYTLRLSALKANGDAGNPAHWEIFNSPTLTIARP